MKKLNLMALLIGAALFTGLGTTSALADGGKCGAAKCGNVTKPVKCGDAKAKMLKSKCGSVTKPVKCGAGKCG